jgi:putative transposase
MSRHNWPALSERLQPEVVSERRQGTDNEKSRITAEQIISILREQEARVMTADVCRRHGINQPTLDNWKAKYGGLDVSDAKRLWALEECSVTLDRHPLLTHRRPEMRNSIAVQRNVSSDTDRWRTQNGTRSLIIRRSGWQPMAHCARYAP